MQGFPLRPGSWPDSVKVCSFQSRMEEQRHPRKVGEQAGNSMNLAVLQVVQLHGYLSLVPRKVPCLLAMMRLYRATAEKGDEDEAGEERANLKRRRLRSKTPASDAFLRSSSWVPAATTRPKQKRLPFF